MIAKEIENISNEISIVIKKKYGTRKNYNLYSPKFFQGTLKDIGKTIKSNWVSTKGPQVGIFEKKIINIVKSKYILATNSGTSAMHLALMAINTSSNDEVLMPSLNFIANANAVLYCGAKPVFLDSNLKNLGISVEAIQKFLSNKCIKVGRHCFNKKTKKKIKALVAVHLFGNACDILEIKRICKKYNIYLIEDAAECMGSFYKTKHLGSFGDFGIISFNGNKVITTAAGGAIISRNKKHHLKIKDYLNLNKSPSLDEEYLGIGYNYKMNALNATLGISQLKKLKYIIKKKQEIFFYYKNEFKNSNYVRVLDLGNPKESNNWLVCVQLNKKHSKFKKKILKELNNKRIYCRSIWKPLHLLPHLKKFQREDLNNTKKIFRSTFCLPSSIK